MHEAAGAARACGRRSVDDWVAALGDWVAIRSVSGSAEHRSELFGAAHWLARRLSAAGASARLLPTPGAPVVVGLVRRRARRAGRRRPAVVVYGHYDVQPPGPGWTSPPFTVVRRGDRLYGRGVSDDKGQLLAHVAALTAWQSAEGPPCDVILVAEGAEEIGSPGFASALTRMSRGLLAQRTVGAVVVSDTRMVGRFRPSVTISQRGAITLDVRVDSGGPAVHAGRFGGAVIDPGLVLARAVDRLAEACAADSAALVNPVARGREPVDEPGDPAVRRSAGGRAVEPTGRLHRRTTLGGSVVATRLRAGSGSTAIPASASARLDVRIPPGADPTPVVATARQLLAGHDRSSGLRIEVVTRAARRGLSTRPPVPVLDAVDAACRAGFGSPAARVRSGGSIPAVGVLEDVLRVPPVLLGLGPPDDRAHGPDEYLDLAAWRRSIDACTTLILTLSETFSRNVTRPERASGRPSEGEQVGGVR